MVTVTDDIHQILKFNTPRDPMKLRKSGFF